VRSLVCTLLDLYLFAIFAVIVLTWFPLQPGGAMDGVNRFLRGITDPVMLPLRRVIPPIQLGGALLDISPIILVLAVQLILKPLICY
jgi:YggT family protein